MIYFDNLTLKAFLEENSEFITGARIQKIQQPTRRDFVLTLRNKGETRKLYINISPKLHHICFINDRNFEIPKAPPMFCMLLRKYIESAKITKVHQPLYERILELFIDSYDELGEKIQLCLAVELMGKHSNVVLYNVDNGLIIGCAHNVGSEKSRDREMAGGLPYIYPPKQNKRNILTYFGEINYDSLSEDFYGFSKAFAEQCRGVELEKLKDFIELKGLSPTISNDFSTYCLFSDDTKKISVNDMIDNYFGYHQEKDTNDGLKIKLSTIVKHSLKKAENSIEKIEKQLQKEKNADRYRCFGDLIMANLYNLKDYAKTAEVTDWENNEIIQIELDETKTLKENANRYFKLYNKSKRSSEKLLELKEKLTTEKNYFSQTLFTIENADSTALLNEIKEEISSDTKPTKELKSKITEEKIEEFTVFIGKNNKQNDYIISKLAKDNDLWFHTKDCPGSHVLLKLNLGQEAPDKIILECAKLAKLNSSGKNSSKIGVIYTKRKYLRKPPAANLGYVTYKNEKEIVLD